MRLPAALTGSVFGALLLCSGCLDEVRQAVQPEVKSLDSLEVERAGRETATVTARLTLSNGNPVELVLDDLRFDLALTGKPVARGSSTETIRLPASSSTPVTVQLEARYKDFAEEDVDAMFAERIPYQMTGTAVVSDPVELGEISIDAPGEIEAPARLEVTVDSRLAELDPIRPPDSGGVFANALKAATGVQVGVRNPFPVALRLAALEYQVDTSDGKLASGELAEPQMLQPGENVVELPVNADVGSGIERVFKSLVGEADQKTLSVSATIARNDRSLILRIQQPLKEKQRGAEANQ